MAFGSLADVAWREFEKIAGAASTLPYQHVPHPTSPESAGGSPERIKAARAAMLRQWNTALEALHQAVKHPALEHAHGHGRVELVEIPAYDLPAGIPAWMRGTDGWAARTGATASERHRTITIQVPAGIIS